MISLPNREGDVEFAEALQRLESRSPWTMTTGRDSSGDYFVSFVTREFSERVTLKSLSRQQLTSLILLLDAHWDEMSWLPVDRRRSEHQERGSVGQVRKIPSCKDGCSCLDCQWAETEDGVEGE